MEKLAIIINRKLAGKGEDLRFLEKKKLASSIKTDRKIRVIRKEKWDLDKKLIVPSYIKQ